MPTSKSAETHHQDPNTTMIDTHTAICAGVRSGVHHPVASLAKAGVERPEIMPPASGAG